jgi:hypothetical protein
MGVISTDFATEAGDGGGAFALGDGVGYDALVGVSSGMPAPMGTAFSLKPRLW